MATNKPADQSEPSFKLPHRPGFARALGEKKGGRTGELREGERARGDAGGGEEMDDGQIDVPHGTDEHAGSDER